MSAGSLFNEEFKGRICKRVQGVLCVPNPRYEGSWMEESPALNEAYAAICEIMPHGYILSGGIFTVEAQRYFIGVYEAVRTDDMQSFEEVLK